MAAEHWLLTFRSGVMSQRGGIVSSPKDAPLARSLRELVDDRLTESFTIAEAAAQLGAHPSHLIRVFSQSYGIAPHQYQIGRRVDLGIDPFAPSVKGGADSSGVFAASGSRLTSRGGLRTEPVSAQTAAGRNSSRPGRRDIRRARNPHHGDRQPVDGGRRDPVLRRVLRAGPAAGNAPRGSRPSGGGDPRQLRFRRFGRAPHRRAPSGDSLSRAPAGHGAPSRCDRIRVLRARGCASRGPRNAASSSESLTRILPPVR